MTLFYFLYLKYLEHRPRHTLTKKKTLYLIDFKMHIV